MDRISSFAKRLKEYRDKNKLTLLELEKITAVPAQTLNRYELAQRAPKIDVAISIASSLNINPLWLQGYDTTDAPAPPDAKKQATHDERPEISDDELSLLLRLRNLSPEKLARQLGYLDSLEEQDNP